MDGSETLGAGQPRDADGNPREPLLNSRSTCYCDLTLHVLLETNNGHPLCLHLDSKVISLTIVHVYSFGLDNAVSQK